MSGTDLSGKVATGSHGYNSEWYKRTYFRVVDTKRIARQLDAMLWGYSEYLSNPVSEDIVQNAKGDIDDFIQKNLLIIK